MWFMLVIRLLFSMRAGGANWRAMENTGWEG
jgi:hypothetical protein